MSSNMGFLGRKGAEAAKRGQLVRIEGPEAVSIATLNVLDAWARVRDCAKKHGVHASADRTTDLADEWGQVTGDLADRVEAYVTCVSNVISDDG